MSSARSPRHLPHAHQIEAYPLNYQRGLESLALCKCTCGEFLNHCVPRDSLTFLDNLRSILHHDGTYYLTSTDFSNTNIHRTSNFTNWEEDVVINTSDLQKAELGYANGKLTLQGSFFYTSSDGETWEQATGLSSEATYYRGAWYGIGSSFYPVFSSDGILFDRLSDDPNDRFPYAQKVLVNSLGWFVSGSYQIAFQDSLPFAPGTPPARWNRSIAVTASWSYDATLGWFYQSGNSDWIRHPALGWLYLRGDYNPRLFFYRMETASWYALSAEKPGEVLHLATGDWTPLD